MVFIRGFGGIGRLDCPIARTKKRLNLPEIILRTLPCVGDTALDAFREHSLIASGDAVPLHAAKYHPISVDLKGLRRALFKYRHIVPAHDVSIAADITGKSLKPIFRFPLQYGALFVVLFVQQTIDIRTSEQSFMKKLLCILVIFLGFIFVVTNVLKLDGARSYAAGSEQGLKTLEHAVVNIRSFQERNGRHPTTWEINCAGYKAIEYEKGVCIETTSLQTASDDQNFVVTYKSPGMYFSGKIGSGQKRVFTYDTKTQSFNYSHADTYAEVLFWRLSKVLLGLSLIFLPILYLRSSERKKKYN